MYNSPDNIGVMLVSPCPKSIAGAASQYLSEDVLDGTRGSIRKGEATI
jgi:hypothetical protein